MKKTTTAPRLSQGLRGAVVVDDKRKRLLEWKVKRFKATPAELLELFWINNP